MSERSATEFHRDRSIPQASRRSATMRHLRTALAVGAGAAMIIVLQWLSELPERVESPSTTPIQTPITVAEHDALITAAQADVPDVSSTIEFPQNLQSLLHEGQFNGLRQALMQLAADAVGQNDNQGLGNSLTLLGVAALAEDDTDSATVYLNEALSVYEELGDELGAANVNLQIGRLHVIERRRARRAALAYDSGLLARWNIAHGNFQSAADSLQHAIAENVELFRYGAAARDYEALTTGYLETGDWDNASYNAQEAAKLHAASGRLEKAQAMLMALTDAGIVVDTEELNTTLQQLDKKYQASTEQLGRARDYNQLYHQLIAQGDPVRAWQFRMQANASLNKASKRARYRRQAGVLVLLYNSNDNMNKARHALNSARQVFSTRSLETMTVQSERLLQEVY